MIQLTAQMRILVAVEPQDFRKGIDGLSRICREVLGSDPLSGKVTSCSEAVGARRFAC